MILHCAYEISVIFNVSNTGAHFVLILSTDLGNTIDMSSPGAVGSIVASVSCDRAGFAKFPAVSEGRQHDIADTIVAHDPPSIVD